MLRKSKPLVFAILFVIAWAFVVMLFAAQLRYGGAEWNDSFGMSLLQWLPWIVFSPLIIWLAKLMPLPAQSWIKHLAIHGLACIAMLFLTQYFPVWEHASNTNTADKNPTSTIDTPSVAPANAPGHLPPPRPENPGFPPHQAPPHQPPPPHHLPPHLDHPLPPQATTEIITVVTQTAPIGIPIYAAIAFLTSLMGYQKDLREREKTAHLLEKNLAEAKLDLLRSQMQPHFLFNALNSISTLIHTAPHKADDMVIQLSDLLRTTLDQRDVKFVTVRKEIKMLENYLNIQSARFGDRLKVSYRVDPAVETLKLPPMIMLPLVENSIAYAVEKSSTPTQIDIEVKQINDTILASVTDNGAGLDLTRTGGTGVGLANIRSRLKMLYPNGLADLTLTDIDGVTATLTMPITQTTK